MSQAKLRLYTAAPSRGSIVRWMLEEVGEPYDVTLLDLKAGDQQKPDYLALNPMGKVPTLVHDGVAISESAAICCYLADTFPAAGLAPPVGDKRRGPYLKWLFYGPSCFEPALLDKALGRVMTARSAAGWLDLDQTLDIIGKALGSSGGPWLLGDQFTAADVVIGAGLRWGTLFKTVPARADLAPYLARLGERPALKRQMQLDAAAAATG